MGRAKAPVMPAAPVHIDKHTGHIPGGIYPAFYGADSIAFYALNWARQAALPKCAAALWWCWHSDSNTANSRAAALRFLLLYSSLSGRGDHSSAPRSAPMATDRRRAGPTHLKKADAAGKGKIRTYPG